MEQEQVVLVDEGDREVGVEEKLAAHRAGRLHRAFSVFVGDRSGRLLLQRRALAKYHSPGLWSNTCCGHPRPGEPLLAAAHRRLREEMGFDCALSEAGLYRYRARLDGGLTENEVDHLVAGTFEGLPAPDPLEVSEWRLVEPAALRAELARHPERFSAWLQGCLDRLAPAILPVAPRPR
jgi:isopentenyl-diphosphate delta-isomerase